MEIGLGAVAGYVRKERVSTAFFVIFWAPPDLKI